MRKTVLLIPLLVSVVFGQPSNLHAQVSLVEGAPPLTAIDFADAEISLAGPESFYIRNVALPDGTVAIVLALDENGSWHVADVVPEDDNLLPDDVVLEFATITALDDDRLEVDGIIFDGRILSGVLDLDASGISSFDEITRRGTLSDREFDYPQTLRDLLLGRRIEEHQAEIARIRAEYENRLSDMEARYRTVVAERTTLAEANEDLMNQVAALRQENDRLRSQVSELEAQLQTIADGGGEAAAPSRAYLQELSVLQSEIASLRAEIAALRAEAARLQATLSGGRGATAPTVPTAPVDGPADRPAVQDQPRRPPTAPAETEGGPDSTAIERIQPPADDAEPGPAARPGVPTDDLEEALPYREGPRAPVPGEGALPDDDRLETPLPYRGEPGEPSLVPADERPPALADEGETAPLSAGAAATEAELRRRIETLEARTAELQAGREEIEREIRESLLADGYIAVVRPTLDTSAIAGLETATAQLGAWQVVGNRALQRDPEMLFAKLSLPVDQRRAPVLYSFEARSTDPADEWVGVGIHIYVDDVEKKGYGLGRSLLVWLTRDREVYKTNYTYLQLYRSDDDINMGRVMDAVIPDPITEFVAVDVLYEPVRQYITIAVDGEEKIRYKTWFGIDEGVEIALRSLGTAEFRNLSVRTRSPR